jgi:hypothetical protein
MSLQTTVCVSVLVAFCGFSCLAVVQVVPYNMFVTPNVTLHPDALPLREEEMQEDQRQSAAAHRRCLNVQPCLRAIEQSKNLLTPSVCIGKARQTSRDYCDQGKLSYTLYQYSPVEKPCMIMVITIGTYPPWMPSCITATGKISLSTLPYPPYLYKPWNTGASTSHNKACPATHGNGTNE